MHQTVNWVLLYKFKAGLPSEFVEMRVDDKTVTCCTGQAKTWGECEELAFDDVERANTAFRQKLSEMEAAGFLLTREWHYNPASFDFECLAAEIATSARKAFAAIREAHRNEKITAYAVTSDDSVMTIGAVANSAEAFLAVNNDPDILWNAAEWSFYEGAEYFDIPYRMLLIRCRDEPEHETIPFQEFHAGVVEACVRALEELDKEGLFGAGQDRENSIVLFQITDSEYLDDAVKRLNTPDAYRRFREWWEAWN